LAELPEHLRDLAERARTVLEADERVRAVWLTGSIAEGRGDAQSDLDLRLAVNGELDWKELVDRISPTVLARKLPGPGPDVVVTCVTPEWLRFDVVIVPTEWPATAGAMKTLFDKDGLTAKLPPGPPPRTADPAFLAEEFLRVLGLTPAVVGREEYLVGSDGVWLLRRMLIDLMTIGQAKGGVKRLNPFLTAEQRATLESLPPIQPTRDAVIGGTLAIARVFLPLARERLGASYPKALEAATLAHLERTLGIRL
jgi:predicted nucleotidyltransferase